MHSIFDSVVLSGEFLLVIYSMGGGRLIVPYCLVCGYLHEPYLSGAMHAFGYSTEAREAPHNITWLLPTHLDFNSVVSFQLFEFILFVFGLGNVNALLCQRLEHVSLLFLLLVSSFPPLGSTWHIIH